MTHETCCRCCLPDARLSRGTSRCSCLMWIVEHAPFLQLCPMSHRKASSVRAVTSSLYFSRIAFVCLPYCHQALPFSEWRRLRVGLQTATRTLERCSSLASCKGPGPSSFCLRDGRLAQYPCNYSLQCLCKGSAGSFWDGHAVWPSWSYQLGYRIQWCCFLSSVSLTSACTHRAFPWWHQSLHWRCCLPHLVRWIALHSQGPSADRGKTSTCHLR